MKPRFIAIPFVVIFFLNVSCSTNPVTGQRDFMLLSEAQEKEMGRNSDPQIVAYFGLYEDQQLQNFINRKGQEMARISHRPELNYTFRIVDSPVINAFAVPGGYVYFTRGIMAHFNNEAEFAGVLGHEIGHITARHSAKQYSRSMVAQLGLAVGSVVSDRFAQFANIAQSGTGLLFLKFGRDAERQSDKLGVTYSTEIGYDAREMAGFFQTLQRKQESAGQAVPNFLSTHPSPGERFSTVNRLARQAQRNTTQKLSVNRDEYLAMIDGLVYGEDPRQGFVENGKFYHPGMRFVFPIPNNWKVQNTPQQVQMAPENGRALIILTLASERSLAAAAQQALQNYKLEETGRENVSVNGLPGLALRIRQTQQNQVIEGLMYLISYNNAIYNFIGITSSSEFGTYSNTFTATARGFKKLTDRNKLNRKPKRIAIKRTSGSGTLRTQLKKYGMSDKDLNELAILNGMNLGDNVSAGTKIKVIR